MKRAVMSSIMMMKSAHDVKNSLSPASVGSSGSLSSSRARRRMRNAVSRKAEAMLNDGWYLVVLRTHRRCARSLY